MLNPAHVHLLLNHVPVIGVPIALLLLAMAWIHRSRDLQLAAGLLLVGMALLAIPVYLTGEPAEERLEGIGAAQESFIDPHEDAALWGLVLTEAGGVLGLGLLLTLGRETLARRLLVVTILVAALAAAALARTALLGGRIRHTEIRPGAASAGGAAGGEAGEAGEADEHR